MRIGGYEFEHVGDIEPMRNADGSVQEFMPQSRYKNARTLPLDRYGTGAFCKFKIMNRLQTGGVYVLSVGDEIRYVGECDQLSPRFNAGYGNISPKNCFKGGQETNCRLNNLIYRTAMVGERISLWFLQTADHKATESRLRQLCAPSWNRV